MNSDNKSKGLASQAEGREFEPRFSLIDEQPFSFTARWLFCFWFTIWFTAVILKSYLVYIIKCFDDLLGDGGVAKYSESSNEVGKLFVAHTQVA